MIQTQSGSPIMETTRISSRNQTVVPAHIRRRLGLKKGDKLIWSTVRVGDNYKIIAEPEPKSWAKYTLGLGKDTWKNINIEKYIKDLRDEWDK